VGKPAAKEEEAVKRTLVAVLVAVMGLTAVTASFAARPMHEVEIIDDTDLNFCGTGEAIDINGTIRSTVWIGTTGGDPTQVVKSHVNVHITYTNPETGDAVVERWSVMRTNEIVAGLESGAHTHEFTENGLKATFRLANGGLLTRDAGSLTYRVTFDENDNLIDFEPITIHGPHPGFIAEGDFFCDTLVPALGLD
jgi:hypothetical protein